MKRAWIDSKNKLISFHLIPHSACYEAEYDEFWQKIKMLTITQGFRLL